MPVLLPGAYSELNTLGGTALPGNGQLRLAVVGRGDRTIGSVNLRSVSKFDSGIAQGWATTAGGWSGDPTTFYYVVTAVNASGETVQSNEVNISVSANDKVTLTWDVITGVGITSYRVWRSASSGAGDYPGTYDNGLVAEVEGELSASYTDTGTAEITASFPTEDTALRVPYNSFRTWTSMTVMRSAHGSSTALGYAAQMAANMGLNVMSSVSVDYTAVDAAIDEPSALVAKQAAFTTAVDELLKYDDPDIVVLLSPEPEIALIGKTHVNEASDLLNRKERMLFCSGGSSSTIGDTATAGTLVYNAVNSFNDRLVAAWAPVDPYAIMLDDLSQASEVALDGSYTALAAAILNVLQADEATPITNKSFSVFTRTTTNYNRADLQILDSAGVSSILTDANGQSTVVHGITTATDTVENSEINIILQENVLLKELRSVTAFAVGLKNSEQVRLAVHDRVAQLLQLRVSQGLMTDFSGLEVEQDPSRPTYILVNFIHTPMYGVNVVFISFAFDTRGGVGAV
jgi:hypothetical protein